MRTRASCRDVIAVSMTLNETVQTGYCSGDFLCFSLGTSTDSAWPVQSVSVTSRGPVMLHELSTGRMVPGEASSMVWPLSRSLPANLIFRSSRGLVS